MKVRRGFVSNSSSSSFVLAFRPEVEIGSQEAIQEALDALQVPKDSLGRKLFASIAERIVDIAVQDGDKCTDLEAILSHYGIATPEEASGLDDFDRTVVERVAAGDVVFIATVSDYSGDAIEAALATNAFTVESERIHLSTRGKR